MMAKKTMLYDATRCTACRGCQVACKLWNDRAGYLYSQTTNTGSYQNPPDLAPQTWTLILVPSRGVCQVFLSFRPEPYLQGHRRFLMSASASSAERPLFPSAS